MKIREMLLAGTFARIGGGEMGGRSDLHKLLTRLVLGISLLYTAMALMPGPLTTLAAGVCLAVFCGGTYAAVFVLTIRTTGPGLVATGVGFMTTVACFINVLTQITALCDCWGMTTPALVPDIGRLPGIDGKAKMSKSLGNCIYLSEESEDIKKKVFSMFTDPNHIRVEDPGSLEGNTVFTYLDAFCKPEYFAEFLPEYQNLDELKAHYQRGGLGDMKVKRFLNNVLQAELEPIRNRRKELQKDIPAIYEILKKGSEKAEAVAAQTLKEVKDAMKINYFDDKALIEAQAERFSK